MAELEDLAPRISKLLKELEKRGERARRNRLYLDAKCPVPKVVESARLTKAYDRLMPLSSAPWATLPVDSVKDRLAIGGVRTGVKDADNRLWREVWQANAMDAMANLGHDSALTDGRAFATIWPDRDDVPEIVLDGAEQVIVTYQEGRNQPRHRVAALRWWQGDDEKQRLTYYTATALYKFVEAAGGEVQIGDKRWNKRQETGRDRQPEPWPLNNPFGVVPVVELNTNRRLQPGAFPYARGEFEHCLGLLDRINVLTFIGLVVALWMGFPLRGVVGEAILKDDGGRALAPFDSRPDSVVQFSNPDARVFQLEAADRANLSIFGELAQFAYVTKTPAHYFPMDRGMSNISAETITALEGGLHAKVRGIHQPFLGEGWEEVLRVGGRMLTPAVDVPPSTEVWWLNLEARSIAERADAAVKLAGRNGLALPTLFVAEEYLGFSQERLRRLEAAGMTDAITRLLQGLNSSGGEAVAEDPGAEAVAA